MLLRKKENKSPAFQFYARDFLADINVQLMNMEQRGMYITLLSYAWLEVGIPNNMRKLNLLCNNPNNFDELIGDVLACFEEIDGRLYNGRMESVRTEQIERKEKASEAGKVGAKKRWQSHSNPIATALRPHSTATSSASAPAPATTKKYVPYEDIVGNYNRILGDILPQAKAINAKRKALIRSIWKDNPDTAFFVDLFTKVSKIPFLIGENDKGWMADFDFILRPDKVTKITEGSYKSSSNRKSGKGGKFDSAFKDEEKRIEFRCPKHPKVVRFGPKTLYASCTECGTRLIDKESIIYTSVVKKAKSPL